MKRSHLSSFGLVLACACGSASKPAASPPEGQWSAPEPEAAVAALSVEPATGPSAPSVNPFADARFYLDPIYVEKVQTTAASMPERGTLLKKVARHPTALWLDSIAMVPRVSTWLEDAARQSRPGEPAVPVFVIYDLPNRDCAAKSSAGELTPENDGEARYRRDFIDRIAEQLAARPEQRSVVIVEPDSLANMATNMNVPKCAKSAEIYEHSVAYAISRLSLPNVFLYLDAAHAGWLGWQGNRERIATIFKRVLTMAGGVDRIRGFATNVSNYTVLRGDDGKRLEPSNPCPDELSYVRELSASLGKAGIADKGFIIDTGRNGRGGIRSKWGNWCNVEGAGLGERPQVAPAELVDAYYWVKPPGASDGTSDAAAPRFDENCRSEDALSGAPQAGDWFPEHFLALVKNAAPPVE